MPDPFKKAEFEESLKQVKAMEPMFIEQCHEVAKCLKHYYNALVEHGFTAQEALEIVKVHGINPGGK